MIRTRRNFIVSSLFTRAKRGKERERKRESISFSRYGPTLFSHPPLETSQPCGSLLSLFVFLVSRVSRAKAIIIVKPATIDSASPRKYWKTAIIQAAPGFVRKCKKRKKRGKKKKKERKKKKKRKERRKKEKEHGWKCKVTFEDDVTIVSGPRTRHGYIFVYNKHAGETY